MKERKHQEFPSDFFGVEKNSCPQVKLAVLKFYKVDSNDKAREKLKKKTHEVEQLSSYCYNLPFLVVFLCF